MKLTERPAHTPVSEAEARARAQKRSTAALTVGAAGVVFGDIGTSPLYALDQIFFRDGRNGLPVTTENTLGAISLVIWMLTIIVAIKYAIFVLRAHNDGEGGVFALYGLLHPHKRKGVGVFLWLLVLGAGLLFGAGIITPAISVLSAVEGLQVAAPNLTPYIIPLTIGLLTALFAVQAKGTAGIGRIFGPMLLCWFACIAYLGAVQVSREPAILAAFNPVLGLAFLGRSHGYEMVVIMGALMLVVTGGEAMYADLGHFGARPIRIGWFTIVYPALLLSYLGQGSYLLGGAPVAGNKIFYSLVPHGLLYPMVAIATIATIVASQALISAAFSLSSQAIGLGLFPD